MSTTYTFKSEEYDSETGENKTVEVEYCNSKDDTWHPVVQEMFNFLKGCGYIFPTNAQMIIIDEKGQDMDYSNRI